jgi:hypothetical protein
MSALVEQRPTSPPLPAPRRIDPRRAAPTAAAAVLAAIYVIVSPPSLDLVAHLSRAKLFKTEGFGIWDNWWYAGHHVPGYSVLFPPIATAITPQLAGALAATATAALVELLIWRRYGREGWVATLWLGVALSGTNLFTGRLTFAFGLLPAAGCALALQRPRPKLAFVLAVATALASPVAALFAALAGAACAVGRCVQERTAKAAVPGLAVAAGALAPVAFLAIAFPEGGTEPFILNTLWPIPLIALTIVLASERRDWTLRAGAILYALGCLVAYLIPSAIGSNAARLEPLIAGPLVAAALWPRRRLLLLVLAIPLLYIQWEAPIRDLSTSIGEPSASSRYWRPLVTYLERQTGPPFRVEIPFTAFHFEAYEIAPRFPLARGWERQLDIKDNALFYDRTLTAATYQAWLRRLAVRFVAVSDGSLDYSAHQEKALIDRGLPYLRLVLRTRHWRVYAVRGTPPIAQGSATATAIGPNWVGLRATRAGTAFVRVRYTPYWALANGCVYPAGDFTGLAFRRPGPARLKIAFSLSRIGARSPRCRP